MDVGFHRVGAHGPRHGGPPRATGHTVRAWNRSPEGAQGIAGVTPGGEPAEAFAGDAVITMLADDAALESVLVQGGLLDGAGRPASISA